MGKTSSMAKLALDWEPSKFNSTILLTLVITVVVFSIFQCPLVYILENLYYIGDGFMLFFGDI